MTNGKDDVLLSQNLDRISEWSHKWEMTFNTMKCSVMVFGKSSRRISGNYSFNTERIIKKREEKDGVTIADFILWKSFKLYNWGKMQSS